MRILIRHSAMRRPPRMSYRDLPDDGKSVACYDADVFLHINASFVKNCDSPAVIPSVIQLAQALYHGLCGWPGCSPISEDPTHRVILLAEQGLEKGHFSDTMAKCKDF